MKIAKLAEINNLPICSHGVHELHVHLLASCPNASYLEFHAWRIDEFIDSPLVVKTAILLRLIYQGMVLTLILINLISIY